VFSCSLHCSEALLHCIKPQLAIKKHPPNVPWECDHGQGTTVAPPETYLGSPSLCIKSA
jgi:hypothetical protein